MGGEIDTHIHSCEIDIEDKAGRIAEGCLYDVISFLKGLELNVSL